MKELSIEQKAKAYDEAIKTAREWSETKNGYYTPKELCEEIFPELKETEDEKIRKALIGMFKGYNIQKVGDFTDKEIIAWLEKQDKIVAYYEDRLDECACKYFNKGYKHALENKVHKFNIGDIISDNNATFRVDKIVKNCIGQDCYFLVNVKCEKNGTRYLKLIDPEGKTHNMGEITWLCEQVDAKFEKQSKQTIPQTNERA